MTRRAAERMRMFKQMLLPPKKFMKANQARGFTLLELLITIAIGLTMAGVTFVALMPVLKQNHVDAAYDTTLSVIRTYRNQSITQSKRYIVTFTLPGTITVAVLGRGSTRVAGSGHGSDLYPAADIQFAVQAGFPARSR